MKRLLALLLTLCLVFGCTSALAAGKLTVNQETYVALPWLSDSFAGYVFAEVENTGDKPVEFGSGIFEILNADGDALESDDIYTSYPSVLAPGEVGYVLTYETVDEAESLEDVSDYTLTVSGKSAKDEDLTARMDVSAVTALVENLWGSTEYVTVMTLTNNSEETIYDIVGSYGVYDTDGKLIYAGRVSTYNIGLPAGQSIELLDSVSSDFKEYWEENSIVPASTKAIAFAD